MNWVLKEFALYPHDGTITAYRQYLQKVVLTRSDFLKETGIYEMDLSHKILIDKG